MCWSPKMDIVAVAFLQTGDVTLYRLNWQKLWTLQGAKRSKAPEGGGTSTSESTTGDPSAEVTALSWRPDGKVLAVGYDDGHLILLDIEVRIFIWTICILLQLLTALTKTECDTF